MIDAFLAGSQKLHDLYPRMTMKKIAANWANGHAHSLRRTLLPLGTPHERFVRHCYRAVRGVVDRLCLPRAVDMPWNEQDGSDTRPVVNILAPTFFSLDGDDMFCGGAERYLIELAAILESMGHRPAIYQAARDKPWVRHYNKMEVRGIPVGDRPERLSDLFHHLVKPETLSIYFAFSLATGRVHPDSLGISHGIWWDQSNTQRFAAETIYLHRRVLSAFHKCSRIVSVDTNTINWLRTYDTANARKCTYLPNFVDPTIFAPHPRNSDRLVVLYPRRLYTPRGFWLLADILPSLCKEHPQLDFHFVGKGDLAETTRAKELCDQFPGRVRWYHLEPDEMHLAYRDADITVIPTVASEGTSLSCLEAMASGNAVIATNVGGLPDLVMDGYNGLLIEPAADRLRQAISRLVCDPLLRAQVQSRGREVSLSFNQERWTAQWRTVFAEVLGCEVPEPCRAASQRELTEPNRVSRLAG